MEAKRWALAVLNPVEAAEYGSRIGEENNGVVVCKALNGRWEELMCKLYECEESPPGRDMWKYGKIEPCRRLFQKDTSLSPERVLQLRRRYCSR